MTAGRIPTSARQASRFDDADKAPDMDTFIKGMGQYRAVPE